MQTDRETSSKSKNLDKRVLEVQKDASKWWIIHEDTLKLIRFFMKTKHPAAVRLIMTINRTISFEDIEQSVMLLISRDFSKFDSKISCWTTFVGIETKSAVLHVLRDQKRAKRVGEQNNILLSHYNSALDEAGQDHNFPDESIDVERECVARQCLRSVVAKLSDQEKQIISMSAYLPQSKIAPILGISQPGVSRIRKRMMNRVAAAMDK